MTRFLAFVTSMCGMPPWISSSTIYDLCRLSWDERYGLASQMRRAAVSVPSNVAEGHAYGPGLRYRIHVRVALGSLAELATELEIAIRLSYVTGDALLESRHSLTSRVSC